MYFVIKHHLLVAARGDLLHCFIQTTIFCPKSVSVRSIERQDCLLFLSFSCSVTEDSFKNVHFILVKENENLRIGLFLTYANVR